MRCDYVNCKEYPLYMIPGPNGWVPLCIGHYGDEVRLAKKATQHTKEEGR